MKERGLGWLSDRLLYTSIYKYRYIQVYTGIYRCYLGERVNKGERIGLVN